MTIHSPFAKPSSVSEIVAASSCVGLPPTLGCKSRIAFGVNAMLDDFGCSASLLLCHCAVDLVNLRIALAVVGEVPALYIMIVRI